MSSSLRENIVSTFLPCDPERIILFGSHARQDADSYSDVDLIIVYKTTERFLDRLATLSAYWHLPYGVDILAYTPEEYRTMLSEENPLLQRAVTEGTVLYEKSKT